MDGTELDEIMAEDIVTSEVTTTETTTDTAEQQRARDEQGRFASATAEPNDQDARAAIEGATVETDHNGTVPQQALHAARETSRQAREENETLRRELAELRGQVTALTPKPAPAEVPKPTNWYADPDKAIAERLNPIQQQVMQTKMETSFMLAEDKFGADVLKAADEELGRLMQANDPSVAALAQQMKTSKHPYRDLVSWHERRKAMSDIGEDPAAYRERVRAELLAEINGGTAPSVTTTAPSTTTPLTKLPPSLNRVSGPGNAADNDTSDGALFAHAMG